MNERKDIDTKTPLLYGDSDIDASKSSSENEKSATQQTFSSSRFLRTLKQLWQAFVQLCYVPVDSDTICMLRIGFGLVMCLQYYHYIDVTGPFGMASLLFVFFSHTF